MTKREAEQAEQLLDDWMCERVEASAADVKGGWCVTAFWRSGGQEVFNTLGEVKRRKRLDARVQDYNS